MRRLVIALLVVLSAAAASAAEPLVARVIVYQRLPRMLNGEPQPYEFADHLVTPPAGGWPASIDEVRELLTKRLHNKHEVMVEDIHPLKTLGGAEKTDFFILEEEQALELQQEGDTVEVTLPKVAKPISVAATPNTTYIFGGKDELLFLGLTFEPAATAKEDTIVMLRNTRPLEVITRVDPVYPKVEQFRNRSGMIFAELKVGKDGSIEQVDLLEHVHPEIDKAIADALKQWKFRPPTRDGKPVSAYVFQAEAWRID